jgi:hypothetical protein
MDEFECVGSGESEARERLNGDRTLYAKGGCGGHDAESGGKFARSRSRLQCDELAQNPSDAEATGFGKRLKMSIGLLRSAS